MIPTPLAFDVLDATVGYRTAHQVPGLSNVLNLIFVLD